NAPLDTPGFHCINCGMLNITNDKIRQFLSLENPCPISEAKLWNFRINISEPALAKSKFEEFQNLQKKVNELQDSLILNSLKSTSEKDLHGKGIGSVNKVKKRRRSAAKLRKKEAKNLTDEENRKDNQPETEIKVKNKRKMAIDLVFQASDSNRNEINQTMKGNSLQTTEPSLNIDKILKLQSLDKETAKRNEVAMEMRKTEEQSWEVRQQLIAIHERKSHSFHDSNRLFEDVKVEGFRSINLEFDFGFGFDLYKQKKSNILETKQTIFNNEVRDVQKYDEIWKSGIEISFTEWDAKFKLLQLILSEMPCENGELIIDFAQNINAFITQLILSKSRVVKSQLALNPHPRIKSLIQIQHLTENKLVSPILSAIHNKLVNEYRKEISPALKILEILNSE
ncbi:hypothetical protein HK096_004713, partial [Nowakowskiella sp. JEL0078]